MRRFNILSVFALSIVAIAAQGVWAADPVLTFGFSDLVGDFTEGSMLFTAIQDEDTNGDVTRVLAPTGTTEFSADLWSEIFPFFSMTMEIMPLDENNDGVPDINPFLAVAGIGTLLITDTNGDTIAGIVDGLWINNGSANFVGTASNVMIVSTDNEFNGTTDVISLDGLIGDMFDGNILTLAFGNWFTDSGADFQSFSGASTLAQGAIVPEPATLCLFALAALSVGVRRRRR
jgi:hypothetical protein